MHFGLMWVLVKDIIMLVCLIRISLVFSLYQVFLWMKAHFVSFVLFEMLQRYRVSGERFSKTVELPFKFNCTTKSVLTVVVILFAYEKSFICYLFVYKY